MRNLRKRIGGRGSCGHRRIILQIGAHAFFGRRISGFDSLVFPDSATLYVPTVARFAQFDIPGTGAPSAADGIRCDADGNIWAGARPGVQVFAPNGDRLGMIRLPETCANVCFGGLRRNRLFMTASQSLYSVYVETVGAHIA